MDSIFSEEYKPNNEELIKMRDAGHTRPSWIKRLWGVRHVRAMMLCYKVNRHYDRWVQAGAIPWNADWDYKVCHAIGNNLLLPEQHSTNDLPHL